MKKMSLLACSLLLSATAAFAQPSRDWAGASWVWDQPDANQSAQTDDPRYLRRTFELPAAAKKAELIITADNEYTVYVNGQKVGGDGEWQTVERYDVARHLTVGK